MTLLQPDESSPASSDSPIFPVPRIASRSAMRPSLGGARGNAVRRLADPCAVGQGDEAAREPGHEVDAREPGPLLVGLQELRGLVALHPTTLERDLQLHQPEVADEAVLAPPEPLEAHDADRPRAKAALTAQPLGHDARGVVLEPLQLDRAAEARERRAA